MLPGTHILSINPLTHTVTLIHLFTHTHLLTPPSTSSSPPHPGTTTHTYTHPPTPPHKHPWTHLTIPYTYTVLYPSVHSHMHAYIVTNTCLSTRPTPTSLTCLFTINPSHMCSLTYILHKQAHTHTLSQTHVLLTHESTDILYTYTLTGTHPFTHILSDVSFQN